MKVPKEFKEGDRFLFTCKGVKHIVEVLELSSSKKYIHIISEWKYTSTPEADDLYDLWESMRVFLDSFKSSNWAWRKIK